MIDEEIENGGVGSGNFGHAGRPGKVGGSSPYEKGYSKPKREAGQKLREAIAPEREKAKIQLQDYKQLYRQKSKEHLDRLRQQYKQEYKEKKDYLQNQYKKQLQLDKEGMYTGMKKPDKQEVKDKLAELKQKYKDTMRKELYGQKKHYKGVLEDIKQTDKEKYKKLYQEQKDKIMGKYKEEYKKRREELRKEPKKEEEPIKKEEEKEIKTELKHPTHILKETKKAMLLNYNGKVFWIPKKEIAEKGLTEKGQKIYEQAPTTREYFEQQQKERNEFMNRTFDFDNNDVFQETDKAIALKWGFTNNNDYNQTKQFKVWIPKSMISEDAEGKKSIPQYFLDKKISEIKQMLGGNWTEDWGQKTNVDKIKEETQKEQQTQQPIQEPKVVQPTTQQTQTTQTDDNTPIQLMGHNFTKDDLKNFVDKYKDSTNKDETHYIASNLILNNKDIKIHGFGGVKGFKSTCFLAEKNGKQAWLNPKDVTPDGKLTAQAETKLQKGVTREQQPDPSKNVFTKDYMMQKETANDFYFQTDSMNGEEGFTIKIPKKDVSVPNTEDHKNEYSIPKDVYEKAKREAIWKKAQQDPAHYSKKYDLKQLEEEFKPKLTPQMTEKIKIQPKTPPPAQIQTSQGYSLELGRVKNFIQEIIDKTEDQTQLNKNGGFKEAILLLNQHDTKNQPITRTNNSVLIKQGDKQGWIPNSYINNDGTLTKAGQKILDEAPKKEYQVKISDEQQKDYTYLKRLDPIQESKTDIKVPVWYKDEYLKRNKIGDVKIPRDFLLADGNSLAIKKTDLEKLVKEQLNYNNPYSEDLYLGTSN